MDIINNLTGHYRTGENDLASEFFSPCLSRCNLYRRAAGYFTSTSLKTWAESLPRLIGDSDLKIKLLISPILSTDDIQALIEAEKSKSVEKVAQTVADNMMSQAIEYKNNPNNKELRMKLFIWLIANSKVEIKFAFAKHVEQPGLYHEKIGIFDFPNKQQVAFVGSANETSSGHQTNYELIHVFRNWLDGDKERVTDTVNDFEKAWNNAAIGLFVVDLSKDILKTIKEMSPENRPTDIDGINKQYNKINKAIVDDKWKHQDEAKYIFIKKMHGVLEMATGTGKTRTALKIITNLSSKGLINSIVVTTEGNDLLNQWGEALLTWYSTDDKFNRILMHYEKFYQLNSFILNPKNAVILISRTNLHKLLARIDNEYKNNMIIVDDEVHGLGSEQNRKNLEGMYAGVKYTLGLSATPEREYDEFGTEFITNEIGPVIYNFSLKAAIKKGILCEFDYRTLYYDLTSNDKERLKKVYSKAAVRQKNGNPMSQVDIWIELARVYKTAEQKPEIFSKYLHDHPEVIKNAIIFVETKEFGEKILPILHNYTNLYRTYYSGDEKENLYSFSRGKIDCLITCHKLSQGIDIKSLETVILFSSSSAMLETIQRIGRCLRFNPDIPDKRAIVIDFIRETDSDDEITSDTERSDWLSELSKTRRIK